MSEPEKENSAAGGQSEFSGLVSLLADIRSAVGDPQGKMMQDELIEHCKKLTSSERFYRERCTLLQREQKWMRDPERTIVCDVLANGALLPDMDGKRYGKRKG